MHASAAARRGRSAGTPPLAGEKGVAEAPRGDATAAQRPGSPPRGAPLGAADGGGDDDGGGGGGGNKAGTPAAEAPRAQGKGWSLSQYAWHG